MKQWSLETLPIVPSVMQYKPSESTKDQLQIIKECFQQWAHTGLLVATDAEREGELIAATILNYVDFTAYNTARRFWVSEALTPDVIQKGINNASSLINYQKYKNEGYGRQHADWLIGMNFTRFMTVQCRTLLSVGRVQTAVLAAIYTREKLIKDFKPEKYYQLKAICSDGKNIFDMFLFRVEQNKNIDRFSRSDSYLLQAETSAASGKNGIIRDVQVQDKKIHPPQLYNLTGLQKAAAACFGFSPKQTLDIAQTLYDKYKCLSYPRTPSRVMGNDNVDLLREKYALLKKAYPDFADDTDAGELRSDNKRIFNSAELKDHHALIPLLPLPTQTSDAERNVYTLVLNSFFSLLRPAYRYKSITVEAEIGSCQFRATGKNVIDWGWKKYDTEENDDEPALPDLQIGQQIAIQDLKRLEKETAPKKHFTATTLLQMMENPKNEEGSSLIGIGTPATRAGIIQLLFDRQYVTEVKKNILITDKGSFLIENIKKHPLLSNFISIRQTTEWEEKLSDNPEMFVESIKTYIRRAMKDTGSSFTQWENAGIGKCPICGKTVQEGKTNYYCTGYKEGCTFVIWKTIAQAAVTVSDIQLLLAGKRTREKKFKNKDGKEFSAFLIFNKGKIEFAFKEKKQKS